MKTWMILLVISVVVLIPVSGIAQDWKKNHDITLPFAEGKNDNGEVTQVKEAPKNIGRVQGTVGSVYTAQDIMRMPTRNVNTISTMTLGAQSYPGQEPIFKGATGGTAYFVDGIRVRSGSLGVAGMGY